MTFDQMLLQYNSRERTELNGALMALIKELCESEKLFDELNEFSAHTFE